MKDGFPKDAEFSMKQLSALNSSSSSLKIGREHSCSYILHIVAKNISCLNL